jgi:hypothetical protein
LDIGVVLQSCFDDTSKVMQGPLAISHSSLALCIIAQHSLRTGAIVYWALKVIKVAVKVFFKGFIYHLIRIYTHQNPEIPQLFIGVAQLHTIQFRGEHK